MADKLASMNDEDFMDNSETWADPAEDNIEEVKEEPTEKAEEELETEQVDDTEDTQEDDQGSEEEEAEEELVDGEQASDEEESEAQVDNDTETQDDGTEKETETTDGAKEELDYKAGYEEIFAPFKAGGKDIKVDSIEDARKLMQMGAGFASNQRKIKPHLKIVKALRKNGLLDPDKVNHLIDLGLGKPEAIAKLVKDNEIDPLDINTKSVDEDYKPTNHEVSDQEFDLDQAIDGIKSSESYDKSIKIMGEQWDEKSRTVISENPQIVGIVDEHVKTGVFDIIQGHVDKERALGRMSGVSDVEAYYMAAETLKNTGVLSNNTENNKESDSVKEAKVAKEKKEVKRNKKRKAAGPVKGKKAAVSVASNDDELSDDEFKKLYGGTSVV